jgi:uncharacterized membrane protein YgcG
LRKLSQKIKFLLIDIFFWTLWVSWDIVYSVLLKESLRVESGSFLALPGHFSQLQSLLGRNIDPFQSDLESESWGRNYLYWRKTMGKKLYVGNMSYDVDNSTLEQMFGAFGTVTSAQVINDRMTGRSKGFGFVEMSSDEEASAAIAAMNGKDQGGRTLTVNEAKPREERSGGGGGGGRSYGGHGGSGGGGGGGRGGFGGSRGRR